MTLQNDLTVTAVISFWDFSSFSDLWRQFVSRLACSYVTRNRHRQKGYRRFLVVLPQLRGLWREFKSAVT